ncbi:DUF1572 family protein [Lewinella sp. 4G2]|uniref:DUF1572 family protein n=1 Tax=Lewinella sp. 4G2 TaxID=1803372 RepID=UPI0007B4745A|nr:DUF1572 family protein [Lewinella sp. 4G2]OAV45175.1 hypothetical protein A3850_012030 [Lewinella sp. 4G2]
MENYLTSVRKQFEYYRTLGDRTFDQLTESQLLHVPGSNSNSIAVMVNHLHGNMKSRWTDFLNSDGEKEWRHRDQEFEEVIRTKADLLNKWNEGWDCLFRATDSITPDKYTATILIRNQQHTLTEAFNRQMMHYAYHVGQIVYVGRMLKGEEWVSLSIPRGASVTFNQKKMGQGTHGGHFTDDLK